jgi:hypothetical protein
MSGQSPQIDLRSRTAERDPEIVRPHASVLEQHLRDALDQSTASPELVETLIGLCELRLVPDVGGSVRGDAWRQLLSQFAALDSGSLYVGAFKVQVDAIAAMGAQLDSSDRALLARLLLDRTAAVAATKRDLRVGARAAHAIDPFVLAPSVVIDNLLRPCIRWGTGARAGALVADALLLTLESLASGSGRSVSDMDVWALRAAFSMIDESEAADVQKHVARVTGADRALIERLLAPEPPARHWWTRSIRRDGAGRSLSLR